MKKVYYSFVLVLMTLMSMNVLADTPIKLDVDDASRIRVKVNYSPIENIKKWCERINRATIWFSSNRSQRRFVFNTRFIKLTKDGEAVAQSISNLTSCNIYLSDADKNLKFTVKSGVLADARTASCTVKVDDATKLN